MEIHDIKIVCNREDGTESTEYFSREDMPNAVRVLLLLISEAERIPVLEEFCVECGEDFSPSLGHKCLGHPVG